jgi:hypothetical protein
MALRTFVLPFNVMATTSEIRSHNYHIFHIHAHNNNNNNNNNNLQAYEDISPVQNASFLFQFPFRWLDSSCRTFLCLFLLPVCPVCLIGRVVKIRRSFGGGRCTPPIWRSGLVKKPKPLDSKHVRQFKLFHTYSRIILNFECSMCAIMTSLWSYVHTVDMFKRESDNYICRISSALCNMRQDADLQKTHCCLAGL